MYKFLLEFFKTYSLKIMLIHSCKYATKSWLL